jgi:hypothetical protein
MRMACLIGHLLVLIHEDIRENHKRCIAFLWNPNGLFVQAKDKSRQNDNGPRPLVELKPNIYFKALKEKSS